MATWFHLEYIEATGTTWRTTQPVTSPQALAEYVERVATEGAQRITIERFSDEPSE